jgi:hypothetical protein
MTQKQHAVSMHIRTPIPAGSRRGRWCPVVTNPAGSEPPGSPAFAHVRVDSSNLPLLRSSGRSKASVLCEQQQQPLVLRPPGSASCPRSTECEGYPAMWSPSVHPAVRCHAPGVAAAADCRPAVQVRGLIQLSRHAWLSESGSPTGRVAPDFTSKLTIILNVLFILFQTLESQAMIS